MILALHKFFLPSKMKFAGEETKNKNSETSIMQFSGGISVQCFHLKKKLNNKPQFLAYKKHLYNLSHFKLLIQNEEIRVKE